MYIVLLCLWTFKQLCFTLWQLGCRIFAIAKLCILLLNSRVKQLYRYCKIYLLLLQFIFKQLRRRAVIANLFNMFANLNFRIVRIFCKKYYSMLDLVQFFFSLLNHIILFKYIKFSINSFSKYFLDTIYFILVIGAWITIMVCISLI